MKVEIILLLNSLIFSLGEVVFPFKTAYININGDINPNSKKYNSTHLMNDKFQSLLYTTLQIGNPIQEIKLILTSDDCGFKIGKADKCINKSEYQSYYNRNKSSNFEYTDLYDSPVSEFDDKMAHSAADSMKVYKDMKTKEYKTLEKMDFYLGSDTNEPICGVIGFKLDRYSQLCTNMSITSNFKARGFIDNYKWTIKYNTDEEGLLIYGTDMEKIISDYDEKKIYSAKCRFLPTSPWAFNIDQIIIGENKETIEGNEMWIELENDNYFLTGNVFYERSINELFFKDFLDKEICFKNIWATPKYKKEYYIIECNKEKFGKKQINKFPSLTFINREPQINITFDKNDLFTETKYKYFFNVVFPVYNSGLWVFGKIFFKKYPVLFNVDQNIIEIYDSYTNNESDSDSHSTLYKVLISLGVIVLFIISGFLFYFLGKNLNKMRKKMANEMDDDFDYVNKNEINN